MQMIISQITEITQWVLDLIHDNLYPGIFLAALLETVFPPIPSEVVFPLAGYVILQNDMGVLHVLGAGVAGGAGSTVGGYVLYFIALKLGRGAIIRYAHKIRISEKKVVRVERWFSKYGDKSVLFGRLVPGIRSLISIPAGLFNMSFTKFTVYTLIGSCAWSITLTAIGYYFGVASTADVFSWPF